MTMEEGLKARVKKSMKGTIRKLVDLSAKTRAGKYIFRQILSSAMDEGRDVLHDGVRLRFTAPNVLCEWRAKTFSTKEPETLAWIDSMPEGAVLWDVGANVGLYSVYAAKRRHCRVWAFEPSIFNLELLARNIFGNDLVKQVCIVPCALSNQVGSSQLHMTTTEWGGALSTFGHEFGWDGKAMEQVFEFQTLGITMDYAQESLAIPKPDYIKMDVDGIEHLILSGGRSVLSQVTGVLIEVNDDFHEQAGQCETLLLEAGLAMKHKLHSEMIGASTTGFQNCYNQIWARP